MTRVLIAGVSTRAAADSAARAGFGVTALDAYADRDQHPAVHAQRVPPEAGGTFSATAAASAAAAVDVDVVTYLSNFENHPAAVAALAAGRTLWGNPPAVLQRARDPFRVAATFRDHGIRSPLVNDPNDPNLRWLVKPLSSGGGHGIRDWTGGEVRPGCYRQERIDGVAASIVFVAAAGRAVPLAVSRQLVGDPRFGSHGYRYCGNILAPVADAQFAEGELVTESAHRLAAIATASFGLVGVNGVDFVARGGAACPIEINPRWSSSMELAERATGISVFAVHAAACRDGALPVALPPPSRAVGKVIVFARCAATIGNTDEWLGNPDIRDVPHPGTRIAAGEPVCTVFAEARDAAQCDQRLVARAEQIYARLEEFNSVRDAAASIAVTDGSR